MNEPAHDPLPSAGEPLPATGGEAPVPAAPASLPCSLCETPVPAGTERCPECGLWRGSHRDPLGRRTLLQILAAFTALYAAAVMVVAFAR